MKSPELPEDEEQRLAVLRAYQVLDTAPETEFDDLVRIAAELLGTPIALVSLLDENRQWFKARHGLGASETPRDISFCGHAILESGKVLLVANALEDERFADNPLVTGDPNVRCYVGAPLVAPSGAALGTLCVIDTVPRTFDAKRLDLLKALARQVVRQLELRRRILTTTNAHARATERVEELENQITSHFSNAIVRQFFELSLEMLCVAGFDTRFIELNPVWERVLGWSLDELIGTPFLSLVHPDDYEATTAEAAKLSAGGYETVGFVNRYRHKDGSYRWLQWTSSADWEGQLFYAAARDVTAEKHVMTSLADTASRMRSIVDTALDAIITIDASGTVEAFNVAASRMFGYASEEILGKNISMLTPLRYRGELDKYLRRYRENKQEQIIGSGQEAEGRRKDGSVFPLELAVSRVDLDDGSIVFTGIIRDISERKLVEQLKDEFISTVSHELRTPLTSISGSLRLIEGGVVGEIPPEAAELVAIASSNAQRLIHLINDILDLEKIESGNVAPRMKPLRLKDIVDRSIIGVQGMARDAGTPIVNQIGDLPTIIADGDRLQQVLTNLLSNAIKFSATESAIEVRTEAMSDRIRVCVMDRGRGLSQQEREHIFERFHQVDGSDARQKGGTGLGLSICKAIVEQHGGEIGVDSTLGQGSTFWFSIPIAPTDGLLSGAVSRDTVLVVEDDPGLRALLRTLLTAEGYQVIEAPSLAAAQKCLETTRPDAILLDMLLPDGSGLDLLQSLGESENLGDVPVIALTASDRPGPKAFTNASLVDWLVKPMRSQQLFDSIRRAVRPPGMARVVVVEDDDMLRRLIATQVESLGIECFEAADGESALKLTREVDPDLIVLDIGLPKLNGFDVVEFLREGKFAATPLIILSNRNLTDTDRHALRLGVTRHLKKADTREEDFLGAVRLLLNGLCR